MDRLANRPSHLSYLTGLSQVAALFCMLWPLILAAAAADYELLANFVQAGTQPSSALTLLSNGNSYGVTLYGGDFDKGTLFQIAPDGTLSTLHSFDGNDGQAPNAALAVGADGALYGSTEEGGTAGFGTLFKITAAGTFTQLANFTGSSGTTPGAVPSGLCPHPNGSLYGLTQAGGANGEGTAFRIALDGQFTHLLDFTGTAGAAPGSQPTASLVRSGDLFYGLTRSGGSSQNGVIFQLSLDGTYSELAEFTGTSGAQAGAAPRAPLLVHSNGKLYGSTESGGSNDQGALFRIDPDGSNYALLHTFVDSDGARPSGPLVETSDQSIWGTTASGGNETLGTVFSITSSGTLNVRNHFSGTTGATLGAAPLGGLSRAANGNLLGTTSAGGPGNNGVVFQIDSTGNYSVLQSFTTAIGWAPSGPPSLSAQDELLFPIALGGSNGNGTIAQILDTGSLQLKASLTQQTGAIPNGGLSIDGSNTVGISTRQGTTDRGAAFVLAADGSLSTLSGFTSTAGETFAGPLLSTPNGFYGLSQAGGLGNHGTLFNIAANGTLSRVFSFSGTTGARKGSKAQTPLARLPDGSIYGLTKNGGSSDLGTLFKLDASGTFSTLVEFDASGPQLPSGGLTLAPNGKLYGCSEQGGDTDDGTLFSFDPTTSTLAVEVSFTGSNGAATGSEPVGTLTLGSDGALYGIAKSGGLGFGAAFRYLPGSPIEILATFTGTGGNSPGIATRTVATGVEIQGGITLGDDGFVYGTLPAGGPRGGGVVFRLDLLTPFQKWTQLNLGDRNAPDTGDPDRDGLSNLLEYALGTLPNVADNPDLLDLAIDQSNGNANLAINFERDANRDDIQIFVESATTPSGPWTLIARSDFGALFTGNATIEETVLTPQRIRTNILETNLLQQGPSGYLRIRITR